MNNPDSEVQTPTPRLDKWQKRQATLLYHYASIDYLKGLKTLLDDFVDGVDVTLGTAQRQGRDRFLTSDRWGVRDTVANFSTYGFAALQDFQKGTARQIALREGDFYGITGYNQCARLLGELSMNWSTPEEQERFNKGMSVIAKYATLLDGAMIHRWKDGTFASVWERSAALFPRLPKLLVRTDIEALSGESPPRAGVYVPQDDPFGSLQFAWPGRSDGELCACMTFNELGLEVVAGLGRDLIWTDEPRLIDYVKQPRYRKEYLSSDRFLMGPGYYETPLAARFFLGQAGIIERPCKWYFVELIEGEFDDPDSIEQPRDQRLRGEPGDVVPRSGWWSTLAFTGDQGRRHFAQGERFPEQRRTDWGEIIWTFDPESQPKPDSPPDAPDSPREWSTELPRPAQARQDDPIEPHEPASPSTPPLPATSAPVAVAARTPLGEQVTTGRACPETGWWVSVDDQGIEGERRHIQAGDRMPHATFTVSRTLWQRLTGKPAHRVGATVWRLVSYDDPAGRDL